MAQPAVADVTRPYLVTATTVTATGALHGDRTFTLYTRIAGGTNNFVFVERFDRPNEFIGYLRPNLTVAFSPEFEALYGIGEDEWAALSPAVLPLDMFRLNNDCLNPVWMTRAEYYHVIDCPACYRSVGSPQEGMGPGTVSPYFSAPAPIPAGTTVVAFTRTQMHTGSYADGERSLYASPKGSYVLTHSGGDTGELWANPASPYDRDWKADFGLLKDDPEAKVANTPPVTVYRVLGRWVTKRDADHINVCERCNAYHRGLARDRAYNR